MIYEKEADLYRDAVLIQDACNLSGVLNTMREMTSWLVRNGFDESAKRRHPAVRAVLFKVLDMMGVYDNISVLYEDYLKCEEMKKLGEEEQWAENQRGTRD